MAHLSERQRTEILMMLGYGERRRTQTEVCNLFNNLYPEFHITQSTVSKIWHKFQDTGSVKDLPKTGRATALNNEESENVMLAVVENPHVSVRQIARDCNTSKSTVHSVLKKEKWHPYKVCVVQELFADDLDRRLEFCEEITHQLEGNANFHKNILFTDEATFCLNGTVNKQNTRYWSSTNPNWYLEGHTQYQQKVNVWAGMMGNQIFGPYFFEGNLTAEVYLNFLRFEVVPALAVLYPNEDDPDIPHDGIWFQQDGAPPHFGINVRQYLNDTFPNRWIGRRGPVEWAARSPDLSPLDFFLWGDLKNKVYVNRPGDIEGLKNRIRTEMRAIKPESVSNAINEFQRRIYHCQAVNGAQFEHLL